MEGNVCLNILREDWKPVLNLNSVMVGLQYLFLEPNADDPLNKGSYNSLPLSADCWLTHPSRLEAANELRQNRDMFVHNVKASMRGTSIKGQAYDRVVVQ